MNVAPRAQGLDIIHTHAESASTAQRCLRTQRNSLTAAAAGGCKVQVTIPTVHSHSPAPRRHILGEMLRGGDVVGSKRAARRKGEK